ncbi:MAG TPA: ATP-binding protein [Longimicrobiaceae bacterium]|nr:ATP-binding protein [Longimicrobiaceae bacterium]
MSEHNSGVRALHESETRFRLLVESVRDYAIFMLDPEGRIVSWNAGAARIKGYTEEEILGKHFSIFYTEPDLERHYPEYELKVAVREGRFEDEGWRVRKDGSRFWANVVITALRDPEGRLVGFAKVTRDLTERRQAESERAALERERVARQEAEELAEQLQQQALELEAIQAELEMANDELQRANAELLVRSVEADRARSEAESANQAKTNLLANMSHELRTPINAIIGYTELLEMGIPGPVTDSQRVQLGRIRVSSRHLLLLIEDILDLSKLEAGRIEVARERGRLAGVLEAALPLIEAAAAEKGLEVGNRCEHGADHFFIGDEGRVRQILVNLLSNAVKFTDPGGRIEIRCEIVADADAGARAVGPGSWLGLRVEDTGVGIPPDQLEAIFEPFVQVETHRARTRGGAGLGLAISRQLARLMGGDLTVTSEVGRGSCFTLWLPAAPAT